MIATTLRKLVAAVALGLAAFAIVTPAVSYAQEAPATPATTDAAKAPSSEHGAAGKDETVIDLFKQGGWVMYPIAVTSILLVWLTVDGYIKTSAKKIFPAASVLQLRELFKAGDYTGAYNFAKLHPSPIADITRAGIAYSPDGKTMTEEAILSELARIKSSFDSGISYISVIGVCTPMIGLTGTVSGMKGAFKSLATAGAGDSGAMAGHIGEVLVATASGLIIAIPAFIIYYLLRNRVTKSMHDLQELAASLFRNMPYDDLAGCHIGDEEIYAAKPNWVAGEADTATPVA
jgi:biopolymer transport protein ExbB